MDRFAGLLELEEAFKNDTFGEVVNPLPEQIKQGKGTPENPLQFPFIRYTEPVVRLIDAVYAFNKENPEYNLYHYYDVLENYGYSNIDYETIDVSDMDDKCLMALFMWLVRGERFCDGLILGASESGAVARWIARLREIAGG